MKNNNPYNYLSHSINQRNQSKQQINNNKTMTNLTIDNQQSFSAFIKENLTTKNNLTIRGMARLVGVSDTALIRGADFKSQKLGQVLIKQGFEAADLSEAGFPPKAVWLVIEYYAYDARVKKPEAIQIARTFGMIGIMNTFENLNPQPQHIPNASPNELILMLAQANVETEKRIAAMEATIASQNKQLEAVKDITDSFVCPEGYETIRMFCDELKDITVSAGFNKSTMAIGNYLKSYDGVKHPNKVYDTKVGKEVNAYEIGAIEDALTSMLTEGSLIAYRPSRGKIQIKTAKEFNKMKGNYKEVFTASYIIDTYFSDDHEVIEVAKEQVEEKTSWYEQPGVERNVMTLPYGLDPDDLII